MYNANNEEQAILKFWEQDRTFEKSVSERPEDKPYVFYDGPPFATGLPHYGHILSSVIKDVVPRYFTMKGFRVRRRWGWDCHGLPIESLIEKELKISGKQQIEELGVDKFNEACRSKVQLYTKEWKKMVTRIGRWVEFDNAYKTMDASYMESVWWAMKTMWDKGLIYEGRKVLMYCPRCETPVSKAEIAMDNSYKDITEETAVAKFKIKDPKKHDLPENTFILAWTTTPWTLPGNVALAVGNKVEYVLCSLPETKEYVIVAAERVETVLKGKTYSVEKSLPGSVLVGIEYEPLFDMPAMKETGKKAYYVTAADFVTTTDGTGVVHTAVIYGEDDYNLGLKLDLPMVPMLNSKGEFNEAGPAFIKGQYFKKAEKEIKKDLDSRGLLFAREQYTHSYPHCWRCETQLFYNAISAWFINIQKVKDRLLELNEKTSWFPGNLKHGRFQNILETAPDWNISRNRYWATPLPFWKCENAECKNVVCVGSVDELRKKGDRQITKIIFVRHGESEKNVLNVKSQSPDKHPLTANGQAHAVSAAEKIAEPVDVIISSPVLRAKETADIIGKKLGVSVTINDLVTEYDWGRLNDVPSEELVQHPSYQLFYNKASSAEEKFSARLGETGESMGDIVARAKRFVELLAKEYQGKTIVVVSHGGINSAIHQALEDISPEQFFLEADIGHQDTQQFYIDENGKSLDLHKHNIDPIKLKCEKCQSAMSRIPEVIDCWAEAGSMPYAEFHYPFENKEVFHQRFPGQFIAEYIAQTRAWFYYMHAMATLLFDNISFENVVCTGTILNEKGEKLSKSKQNYPDPWKIIETYGMDTMRYYMMTSVVMQADDLFFNEREVREVYNKVINILWNVVTFYQMYAPEYDGKTTPEESKNVLDHWILAKLNILTKEMTESMDKYDTVRAGRPIKEFIDELSTWYLRRSRDRFKGDDAQDKQAALATLREVLVTLAKLMAPFMPFIAEKVWQEISGQKTSVHLELWPLYREARHDHAALTKMEALRKIVELGLALRAETKVKVRQPLGKFVMNNEHLGPDFLNIIAEELNVKDVSFGEAVEGEGFAAKEDGKVKVWLNTTIDEALKKEGLVREIVRTINQMRKEQKLTIDDKVAIVFETDDVMLKDALISQADGIKGATLASSLTAGTDPTMIEVEVDGKKLKLAIKMANN